MYPSDKDLLDIEIRKKLKPKNLKDLISELSTDLEDHIILEKLRQIRNTFATGGVELFQNEKFDYDVLDGKLFELFKDFVYESSWKGGIIIIIQIYCNLAPQFQSPILQNLETKKLLNKIDEIDIFIHSYLAALVYIYQKKNKKLILKNETYSIYVWHFLKTSTKETEDAGWLILLINLIFDDYPHVLENIITMENLEEKPEQFLSLIELFKTKIKEINICEESEKSLFNLDIIINTKEIFFNLCNCLVAGAKDESLPFGTRSIILFEILSFLAICSGRFKSVLSTESMIVAICGILKRCWEISIDRADELQPKLNNDGDLPQKSEFIEIMFSVWKDSVRILANILDDPDAQAKKSKQDLVRTLGAIPAVLAAAGTLHINQIRNWSVQTISQITENNSENQKFIDEMKKIRNVDMHGVSVDRLDGKYQFKRIPKNDV